eukprot:gene7946-biopygen13627
MTTFPLKRTVLHWAERRVAEHDAVGRSMRSAGSLLFGGTRDAAICAGWRTQGRHRCRLKLMLCGARTWCCFPSPVDVAFYGAAGNSELKERKGDLLRRQRCDLCRRGFPPPLGYARKMWFPASRGLTWYSKPSQKMALRPNGKNPVICCGPILESVFCLDKKTTWRSGHK